MENPKVDPFTLGLGDVIRLSWGGPYADCTVYRITSDSIHVWRPYVHTADFQYSGGVIPFIGIEDFTLSPAGAKVTLLRKGDKLR